MKSFEKSREHKRQVQKLVATMDSFYNIVSELKVKPEKIHSQQGLLRRIAQQTTECCYFIREYANTEGFGELHLVSMKIFLLIPFFPEQRSRQGATEFLRRMPISINIAPHSQTWRGNFMIH